MANNELDDLTVVPLPTGETEAEHQRIRSSNDRDQKLEREGKIAPHNRGTVVMLSRSSSAIEASIACVATKMPRANT